MAGFSLSLTDCIESTKPECVGLVLVSLGCGSSIVGEEKIKTRKDGTRKRFVYYHCSRQVDYNCKELFAREATITEELSKLSSSLISIESQLEPGLTKAIDRFEKIISITRSESSRQTAINDYINYVLKEGTIFEKTRLIRNLNIKLALHDRKLVDVN